MSTNSEILRKLLKRGVYLENLTLKEIKDVTKLLEKANNEIIGKIMSMKISADKTWIMGVKQDIDEIYKHFKNSLQGELFTELETISGDELSWITDTFNGQLKGVYSFTTPPPGQVWSVVKNLPASGGSTLGQLIESLELTLSKKATEAIQIGIIQGETNAQLVNSLQEVMDISKKNAFALVRTATMHVSNQAREVFYKENEEVIKGYQYVATLDLDTCLVCGILDGKVYKLDEPRPELPQHPNCRCLYVPVLKSWREMGFDIDELPEGTRSSLDGYVPESETFMDRLKKATREEQITMLGKTRAELFNSGVQLTKMIEGNKLVPVIDLLKYKK